MGVYSRYPLINLLSFTCVYSSSLQRDCINRETKLAKGNEF